MQEQSLDAQLVEVVVTLDPASVVLVLFFPVFSVGEVVVPSDGEAEADDLVGVEVPHVPGQVSG